MPSLPRLAGKQCCQESEPPVPLNSAERGKREELAHRDKKLRCYKERFSDLRPPGRARSSELFAEAVQFI